MKVRITDLMDLYEDENCPLKPVGEAEMDGAPSAPTGAEAGAFGEVNDVKQSKYPFGWKQVLSLAAVLGLLILSGFGVRWLMNRSAAPLVPGGSGTDAQITSTEHGDPSPIPLAGEEQKALSSFLSFFAMQQIQNYPEELSDDGALIHLAFLWRRYYDPESFTIREVRPVEGLTPEQVNETLERLLGKTVTPPEDGADFDYSGQLGQPAGSTLFSAGCFWDNPTGKDASFFFALAEEALPLPEPGRETVRFNVYYVNYERWGTIDMAAMSALSTTEAEALAAEDKLILTATGEAKLERTEDGYRLISYLTDGSQVAPTEPPEIDTGEDTGEDLHTEPTGFDPVSAEDWECINGHLTNAARYGFPKIDENGDLASTDVEFPNCFALASALTGWDDDSCEVSFEAYEAYPERWPEFLSLNPALIENPGELIEAGKIRVVGSGTATFRRVNGALLLTGCSVSSLQTKPALGPEDPALKAELEALFSDPQSWYARALSSSFADPADVDLYLFFYDGLGDGAYASDEELRQIYKPDVFEDGHFMGPPVDRMDRAGMDEVLKQIFGLDLDRSSKRGLDRFHYLEETDAYYHCHGDTNAMAREIAAARRLDDGTVLFTYRTGFWHDVADGSYPSFCTVGLRPDGKGRYQVLWNLPGAWVTAEDLGELSSLFRLSGPQRAETRDADGTVTVRELDFLEDGELRYREGDPESEFSYWASGSWWIDKDLSFRCVLCEEEEDGSRIGEWYAASYACAIDGDALVLTQQSETGFAEDAPGTELRFAPTAE